MDKKPLILVTNDDGIQAKGIHVLVECLRELGDVVMFAPDGPRSGMSSAITSIVPISYTLLKKEEGLTVYRCTGTPVDCVKLAINEVLERKPDLLVSGINHGGNQAISVHYSGTMGAAIEGCVFDIPSIGVSLLNHTEDADFQTSCVLANELARKVLKEGLPHGTYLNLNVPNVEKVKGVAVCRQADGRWVNEFHRSTDAKGNVVFWLTGQFREKEPILPDNDTLLLAEGYASLVPCKIDVTDYTFMDTLQSWELGGK